ncbi:MAG: hypothetical protein KDB02_03090 [Acidimicrobiales bacterium]|nr:hypothetical protein [Acidimicrobiales bacterium]
MPPAPQPRVPAWCRSTVVLPLVVGSAFFLIGVGFLLTTWTPIGDFAVAELVIRHATRFVPLSGPYSADRGYNHPLPLVYLIQWLPYHLFGERSSAGLATSIWWNGAWLTFLVWLTARLRMAWLGLAVLAATAVLAARTPSLSLLMPWNPTLGLIPSVVLVFACWRLALGSHRYLPLVGGLSVWCVGAHLGFVPMVVPMVLAAVTSLVAVTVRRHGARKLLTMWRPAVIAVAVGLLLASPMIVDVVRNRSDSNPAHILDNGRADQSLPRVQTEDVTKVLRAELAIPPAWGRPDPAFTVIWNVHPPRFPWMVFIGAVAAVAALRRKARGEVLAMGLSLLGLLGAVAGLATITGQIQPWYLIPAHSASMALYAIVAWSGGRSIAHAVRTRRPAPATEKPWAPRVVALQSVVAMALVVSIVPQLDSDVIHPPIDGKIMQLTRAATDALPAGSTVLLDGPIAIDGFYTAAIALQLDKAGFAVRVPWNQTYVFTDALRLSDSTTPAHLVLKFSKGKADPPAPDAVLLAEVDIGNLLYADLDRVSLWLLDSSHPGRKAS